MDIICLGRAPLKNHDPHHFHNSWEIICGFEGKGYVKLPEGDIPFDEYTVLCVPPGVMHSKHSDEGFRDAWVMFSDFPSTDGKTITIVDDPERSVFNMMNVIYTVSYSDIPQKKAVADSILGSLKELIIARMDGNPTDTRVEEIKNEIAQGFQSPDFSVTDCLDRHGYCTDHMRRIFKEKTGMTPAEYLTDIRIKNAQRLLRHKELSNNTVTEISELSGYSDVSYFSRIFKKKIGVSPTEYCEAVTE